MSKVEQMRLWDGVAPRVERAQLAGDAGIDADVVPLWLVRQHRRGVKSSAESLRFTSDEKTIV